MLWSTLRLLRGQPGRIALTVSGISLSVLLMGFLLALYRGVEVGSVAYLRATNADAWVVQSHTTNILRGFSVLTAAHGTLIRDLGSVDEASPILFRLSSIETPRGAATVYVAGYDLASTMGGPPHLVAGRTVERTGEIVLDAAFADKWGIAVDDEVWIQSVGFRVVGLSGGTNMVVIQYAFAAIEDVREMYGFSGMVSVYAVRARARASLRPLLDSLRSEVPGTAVFTQEEFVAANLREMESGFLPVLFVLAFVGIVTLGSIVSLLLTLDVLERRTDLAVLKTIGAPSGFLPATVVVQALMLASVSFVIAAGMAYPMSVVVRWATPEVAALLRASDVAVIALGLLMVAVASTIVPLRRLRAVYPTEAFV